METLDHGLLELVKEGFVPMPGGQAEPVAGASQMTAGLAGPMQPPGGMPPGGDPMAAGGMPPGGDPMAAGGAPPMDPMAAGGMPPMDMGMGAPPGGQITLTVPEFIELIAVIKGDGGGAPPAEAPAEPSKKPKAEGEAAPAEAVAAPAAAPSPEQDLNGKLDQILAAVQGGGMGAPPMDPAMAGGAPMMGGGAPPMPMM